MSKVIVVDDDITMIRLMQLHLRRLGIAAHFFQNATDCLRAAEAIRPDLVLLDYDLPDAKGTELMRQLRALPGLDKLPALVFTARTGTDVITQIQQSGADGVFSKPFSPNALVGQIKTILNARTASAGEPTA